MNLMNVNQQKLLDIIKSIQQIVAHEHGKAVWL